MPGNSMANAEEDHSGSDSSGKGGKGKGPSPAEGGSGSKGNGGKGKVAMAMVGGKGEDVSPEATVPAPPAADAADSLAVSQLPGGAAGWSSNWQMWEAECDLAAVSPFAKHEVGHNGIMNWGAELEFPGVVIDGSDGIEGDGTKALGSKSRSVEPNTKLQASTSAADTRARAHNQKASRWRGQASTRSP